MQLLGFFASVLIGLSLGLIGGGGSILTLPVLVYLLGINPIVSTAYSLFVVGSTSLIGAITYMRKQQVNYKVAILFSIPSFVAVFLTRRYLLPAIPDPVYSNETLILSKNLVIMLSFAVIMLAASWSMIRGQVAHSFEVEGTPKLNWLKIAAEGAIIGLLTGAVGAGGGFLIIPALVLLARLPMKMAVGTSLLIIAIKSLIGFIGDLSTILVDWRFLLPFTGMAIVGIVLGSYLSRFLASQTLKKAFGVFVLLMSLYIFTREVFL